MAGRTSRLEELEQRFSDMESKLEESPEKEAISILHALIHESRRISPGDGGGNGEVAHVSLDDIANLYKSAPDMKGKAENDGLPVGSPAPDFSLLDAAGNAISLKDFQGQTVVLVFYPLDWSPACSDQLSLYQSELAEFNKHNAQVMGVSVDSIYSHGAWAAVRGLNIPLLADFHPKGEVSRCYQVYRESDGFSERALYVIDGEGVIRFKTVSPELDQVPSIYELLDQIAEINESGGTRREG